MSNTYDDDEFPVNLGQIVLISENHFIRRANNWKLGSRSAIFEMLHHVGSEDLLTVIFVAMVHNHRDGRCPFVELIHPVTQGTERRNDQMRTEVVLLLAEQRDQCNCLNSFACIGSAFMNYS